MSPKLKQQIVIEDVSIEEFETEPKISNVYRQKSGKINKDIDVQNFIDFS